ncbi:MAG TPA: hypothetical protein PLF91_03905 [Mycolicibacterium fallax]|nr:hypothetical protein [Mycolicibacterium fallax]
MAKVLFMGIFGLIALGMVASILQALATVLALLIALVALGMVGVELHKQRWSKPPQQLPGRRVRVEVEEWGQSTPITFGARMDGEMPQGIEQQWRGQ